LNNNVEYKWCKLKELLNNHTRSVWTFEELFNRINRLLPSNLEYGEKELSSVLKNQLFFKKFSAVHKGIHYFIFVRRCSLG